MLVWQSKLLLWKVLLPFVDSSLIFLYLFVQKKMRFWNLIYRFIMYMTSECLCCWYCDCIHIKVSGSDIKVVFDGNIWKGNKRNLVWLGQVVHHVIYVIPSWIKVSIFSPTLIRRFHQINEFTKLAMNKLCAHSLFNVAFTTWTMLSISSDVSRHVGSDTEFGWINFVWEKWNALPDHCLSWM